MANATTTTLGDIQLAGDLAGNNNALAPELTATGVTAGSYTVPNVTVDAKGRITAISNGSSSDVTALIPDATVSVKGKVKIGTGLTVTSGVVALDVPDASTSAKGIIQITAGNGLGVTSGILSFTPVDATTSVKGVVKIGNGLSVTGGVVTFNQSTITNATTSVKGLVQIGSGLSVTNGVVSIDLSALPVATSSVLGLVKVGTSLQINSGVLDVGTTFARTDTVNTYSKAQVSALSTLTDAATIAVDLSLSNTFMVTLAGNRTLGAPTNPVIGGQYTIVLKQDATGSRTITWPASFKFRSTQDTTLSTLANKYDICTINYVATGVYLCDLVKGF